MAGPSRHALIAPALVTGYLFTLAQLAYRFASRGLGPNPIATALNQLGLLTLALLTATLCCTPLKLLFGWTWPLRIRRTLGLLAFASAMLHFLLYLGPDQGFDLVAVARDVSKRPFIAVGLLALTLLVPLAWTSTKRAVQRLTFPVWKRLHYLIYPAALLGILHFYWRVKADHTQPFVYGAVILAGFALRGYAKLMKSRKRRLASR